DSKMANRACCQLSKRTRPVHYAGERGKIHFIVHGQKEAANFCCKSHSQHAKVSFPDGTAFSTDAFCKPGCFSALSDHMGLSYLSLISTCLFPFPHYSTFAMASVKCPGVKPDE